MRYYTMVFAAVPAAVMALAAPSASVRAETDAQGFVRTTPEQVNHRPLKGAAWEQS